MAWSHLQSAGSSSTSGLSLGVAYTTANLTAGSTLVAVAWNFDGTVSSVKDGAGNAFSKLALVDFDNSSARGEMSLWAITTPSADAGTKPTITATWTNSVGGVLIIQEVSGIGTTLDGTYGTSGGLITAYPQSVSTGSYSSSTTNEYLLAIYGDDNFTQGDTAGSVSGSAAYTLDAANQNATTGNAGTMALAYGNSTHAAESATFTVTGTFAGDNDYGTILAAFPLSASTGPPAVLPPESPVVARPMFAGVAGMQHSR